MKRREVIALLGGAAVAWPLPARAQQPQRMPRVGVLMGVAEADPEGQARIAAFRLGLTDLGWVDGRNLRIEYRWAAGDADRIREYTAELVALAPDVLIGNGTAALAALRDATRSIPIIFVLVNDPVGQGFIPNLARPGGNIPASAFLNIRWWENRWRCSGNSRRTSIAWPSCSIRRPRPTTRSSCVHSRPYRHQVRWRSRQLP